ncbi:Hypothetical predicted protein, partial [Paramuricea clavata]
MPKYPRACNNRYFHEKWGSVENGNGLTIAGMCFQPMSGNDPSEFEKNCKQVGAEELFKVLFDAMSSNRMSDERHFTKLRTMVVIYIMMYSHSQSAKWFQITLSGTLQQFGISDQGLASLRNLGAAAHLHDYHNIHAKNRPEAKTQTQAVHMSMSLVKVFPNVEAISKEGLHTPLLPPAPVQPEQLSRQIGSNMAGLSQSYATNMPDWVLDKYFDPEAERHRLLLHDYQQTKIQKMRYMENTKLIDSLHLPLKSYEEPLTVFKHMLSNGLEIYLSNFLPPFMGNWPTQFFMRQLVYNLAHQVSLPTICQNVVPLMGPLHISLNSRECVLKHFHPIFAELYSLLFGKKAKLAGHLFVKVFGAVGSSIYIHVLAREQPSYVQYHSLRQALVAFDEYPVENFHSVLQAKTNATDNAKQISLKAKEIDA